MDRQAFEARLKEDGYTAIEAKVLQARPANDEHDHDHDHDCAVRGLVLSGTFIVKRGDVRTAYRVGEIFWVAAGEDHSEEIGPEGAEVVVGRRY